jgi:hypothetical protein
VYAVSTARVVRVKRTRVTGSTLYQRVQAVAVSVSPLPLSAQPHTATTRGCKHSPLAEGRQHDGSLNAMRKMRRQRWTLYVLPLTACSSTVLAPQGELEREGYRVVPGAVLKLTPPPTSRSGTVVRSRHTSACQSHTVST